jgi:hypothetical protein
LIVIIFSPPSDTGFNYNGLFLRLCKDKNEEILKVFAIREDFECNREEFKIDWEEFGGDGEKFVNCAEFNDSGEEFV